MGWCSAPPRLEPSLEASIAQRASALIAEGLCACLLQPSPPLPHTPAQAATLPSYNTAMHTDVQQPSLGSAAVAPAADAAHVKGHGAVASIWRLGGPSAAEHLAVQRTPLLQAANEALLFSELTSCLQVCVYACMCL